MSIRRASPKKIQSNKLMPPGATIKYIKVNQGKNKKPNKGHKIVEKVALKYAGLINHQKRTTALGPIKAKIANPQHIFTPFS